MEEKMKKILLLVFTITLAFSLTGCFFNNVKLAEAGTTVDDVNQTSYENNLTGLSSYFKDKGFLAGDPTEMSAELIGAKAGLKYQFTYEGSKVKVELYEYDLDSTNDTANEFLETAKNEGKITVQNTTSNVTISNNGKYLMIYTKDKDNDENIKREEEVTASFKTYKM